MSIETDLALRIALRIGKVAQMLHCSPPQPLVEALQACVGFPFTEEKLDNLKLEPFAVQVRRHGMTPNQDLLIKAWKQLCQDIAVDGMSLDPVTSTPAKEQGAIRVALASNTQGQVDGHFGSCLRFEIFDVAQSGITPRGCRGTQHLGKGKSMDAEKTNRRISLVRDCDILAVQSIGGPPAARVINSGIMPLKLPVPRALDELLAELRQRLDHPPPWMALSMRGGH